MAEHHLLVGYDGGPTGADALEFGGRGPSRPATRWSCSSYTRGRAPRVGPRRRRVGRLRARGGGSDPCGGPRAARGVENAEFRASTRARPPMASATWSRGRDHAGAGRAQGPRASAHLPGLDRRAAPARLGHPDRHRAQRLRDPAHRPAEDRHGGLRRHARRAPCTQGRRADRRAPRSPPRRRVGDPRHAHLPTGEPQRFSTGQHDAYRGTRRRGCLGSDQVRGLGATAGRPRRTRWWRSAPTSRISWSAARAATARWPGSCSVACPAGGAACPCAHRRRDPRPRLREPTDSYAGEVFTGFPVQRSTSTTTWRWTTPSRSGRHTRTPTDDGRRHR